MAKEEIKENLDNTKDEDNEVEEKVKPKEAKTYGDPIVELF